MSDRAHPAWLASSEVGTSRKGGVVASDRRGSTMLWMLVMFACVPVGGWQRYNAEMHVPPADRRLPAVTGEAVAVHPNGHERYPEQRNYRPPYTPGVPPAFPPMTPGVDGPARAAVSCTDDDCATSPCVFVSGASTPHWRSCPGQVCPCANRD